MFKQEPPKFTYTANENEFDEFRENDGTYVYGRKLEVELLPWQSGYYMSLIVSNLRSNFEKGNHQAKIFITNIYDNKEMINNWQDKDILAALAENQIRGKYAESLIYTLVLKYGQDILAEYFPRYYNYLRDNKVFGDEL